MAGNFTINVVVSGAGQGGQGGGGAGAGNSAVVSAVAGAAISNASSAIPMSAEPIANSMQRFAEQMVGSGQSVSPLVAMPGGGYTMKTNQGAYNRQFGKQMTELIYKYTEPTQIRKQSLFRRAQFRTWQSNVFGILDEETGQYIYDKEETLPFPWDYKVGNIGLVDHAIKNSKRYGVLVATAGYKIVQSAVNITEHQSGDKYFNQQINNASKLAGYASAVAFSGPLAPFVTAGIAINEAANAITGVINYNFDRKLERQEITNTLALAGNASYGRNRGVGF